MQASEAILEKSAKTPGQTSENPPCPEASYSTVSPEFSDWKLVTKKVLGEAIVPRGTRGYKGYQQLIFGTLKLQALNKGIQYSLEKIGNTEKNGQAYFRNCI